MSKNRLPTVIPVLSSPNEYFVLGDNVISAKILITAGLSHVIRSSVKRGWIFGLRQVGLAPFTATGFVGDHSRQLNNINGMRVT